MKKWALRLGAVLVILIAGLAALVFAARTGWLTPDDATLRARYALPESQFILIDDETVHFTDQGQGPAIVLIHGSYGSLRNWEEWVEVLKPRYRVIRFDRPHMGLSGPAAAGRSGADQELRIVAELTRRLGVERFFLVATSSAGVSGAAYAAEHPDQVRGLVLSNIAVGDFTGRSERTATFRLLLAVDSWLNGWRSTEFWRQVLLNNFENDDKATEEIAREWSELNNRTQRMPPRIPLLDRERTVKDLQRMTVSTLLLWSDNDHERPVEVVGQLGLELLASRDKKLEVVPNCGHILPLDCGAESVPNAAAFFDRVVAFEGQRAQSP